VVIIRDFSTIVQLIVLSNLESSNAKMIADDDPKEKRLEDLNKQAIREMKSLKDIKNILNIRID
jgi:hypothetical protein